MKKFLLTLACLFGLTTVYADVTETFNFNDGWLPDKTTTKNASDYAITATSPNTNIVYSLVASYCNSGYTYLMLGSKECKTEASMSFALPANCTGFSIVTGANASASAVYTLTIGNTAIDAGTKWGKGATKVFTIPTDEQVAGNIVKIASKNTSYNGQIASITFVIKSEVTSPMFSVAEGVFTEPFDLTLSAEEGNSIYYTLDGTNPTTDSNLYQGESIKISEYTVVKAIAIDKQGASSSIATATYAFQNTENTAMTVAEALAWIEAGKDATTEQYVVGYITEIEEISAQYGNATYNIADAIGGTDVLKVYRGKYLNGEKFTAEDQIEAGDKVLIYGKLKDYNGTPEMDTNNYIISILEDVSTGVEEIAVENAPVEYYNLQGVKVARPENGIFIKKQGSKATKVVL